ncbi:MAG: LPS assembly protein LptD [Desulfovibrionales bacterium]|nr:LPS assembly protein LptD [Desulfovibrionales bacterium]
MPIRLLLTPIILSLCLLYLTVLPTNAIAIEGGASPDNQPWLMYADKVTTLEDGKIIIAEGNVILSRGDMEVRADYIRYRRVDSLAWAKGHLNITMGEDILTGEEGEINLDRQTGTVKPGGLFLKKNNVHLKAAEIVRVAEDQYSLKEAVITTCDGERPAWRFSCSHLDVTVEGYAKAQHSAFWVRSLPVIYSPYLVLPAKTKRQSGLLFPEFSYGERDGLSLNLPFYWAIDPCSDATFYQHYLSKRGWMEGVEYRYAGDQNSKGILLANYLHDRLEDDDYDKDGVFRSSRNRWWIRGKIDQYLPLDIMTILDLDLVSDRDYLHEFDDGLTGFTKTNQAILDNFGRSLADKTALVRESTAQVNRRWTNFYLSGQCKYYDNLNRAERETTLQVLPSLNFQASRQALPDTPLYYEGNIDYIHYWRKQGVGMHRLDIYPKISWPLRIGPYLDLQGLFGVRETVYDVKNYGDDSYAAQIKKDRPIRTLHNFQADLSTEVGRVFKLAGKSITKIKHTIKPSVVYDYLPTKDQNDLPNLDDVDRISSQNIVTYSLTNYLTTKQVRDDGGSVYKDIFRLKLSQSYNIREERRLLAAEERRRPFSNVSLEAELAPTDRIYARYDTSYNTYDSTCESYNGLLRLSDKRRDSLSVDYRYTKGSLHELNTGLSVVVTPAVTVNYENRRSLDLDKNLESKAGLNYQAQCWGVSVQFSKTREDRRFFVLFSLYGVGDFGPLAFSGAR